VLEFTLNHPMLCSTERFWTSFLDPDFTREMLVEGLGFRAAEVGVLEPVPGRTVQRRAIRMSPKLDLPAAVTRVLGDALSYRETGTYDPEAERWTFESRMNVLADRLRIGGRIWVEPTSSGRSRRISELWIDAQIFGVGGMIERAAEANMRIGFKQSAKWMNDWFVQHSDP